MVAQGGHVTGAQDRKLDINFTLYRVKKVGCYHLLVSVVHGQMRRKRDAFSNE
ncbi:hypothetical protein GGD89_002462 [Roseospira visakhapatnamensis]|uniref:Uncharacterized protein n=1 Tax=Roseospira visakhapatnamensis TaxID=390880 RepID=A0A7W6WAT1_9PROT|nr:hypothetical protein [Roseospira visakhapatnamensis]